LRLERSRCFSDLAKRTYSTVFVDLDALKSGDWRAFGLRAFGSRLAFVRGVTADRISRHSAPVEERQVLGRQLLQFYREVDWGRKENRLNNTGSLKSA
jgi:hypothetical protein